jgi:tetratricopeptide (TPR) repeat protein
MNPPETQPAGPPPQRQPWSLALLAAVLLLTAAAYAPVLSAPFAFDDFTNITDNPFLPREHLDLGPFLSSLPRQPNPFRPLAYLSFALNFVLFGPGPKSFHLVNLAIHLFSCVTLYFLLSIFFRRLGARPKASAAGGERSRTTHQGFALATTALWALHPVQTEAVSYVVQRMTSLAGLFYLNALLSYVYARTSISPRRRKAAFAGLILFGISACATKETSFTLPVFLLALEYFFFSQPGSTGSPQVGLPPSRRWLMGLAFLLLLATLAAALLLGPWTLRWISQGYALRDFTLAERLLTQARVVFYYLFLAAWPIPQLLRLQYDFSVSHSLLDPVSTLFAALGLIALAAAFLIGLRKRSLRAFGILWFFGQLAIESSFIPLELCFEHRLYLPVAAPVVALVFLVLAPGRFRKARLVLVGMAALLLGADTYARNRVWTDSRALWRDAVKKSPGSARAWVNLATTYRGQEDLSRALHAYQQAIRLNPRFTDAYLNLSGLYSQLGQTEGAWQAAEKAVTLEPGNVRALLAMGEVENEAGHLQKAYAWYQRAQAQSPDHALVLEKLGSQLLELGDPDGARQLFRRLFNLYPERPGNYLLLGNSYFYQGRWNEAAAAYQQELNRGRDSPEAENNLGIALLKLGRPDQARAAFERAARGAPRVALFQENLCEAYFDLGQFRQAEAACLRSVALDPSLDLGWKKLSEIYTRQGRPGEARQAWERARQAGPPDPGLEQGREEPGWPPP